MNFDFDIITPMWVLWSCGSAQVTYPIVGIVTFAMGCIHTIRYCVDKDYREKDPATKTGWLPFGVATICLIPIGGGIIAGKMMQ